MIDPVPGDEGRWVTYIPHVGMREAGIVSSWNDSYVFVRYSQGDTAAATLRDQLEWGKVGNVHNRITGFMEIGGVWENGDYL